MADVEQTVATPVETNILERLLRSDQKIQGDETERGSELTAILTHAVHDQNPSYSLRDVAHALVVSDAPSDLDALDILPLLLCSEDSAADDILSLLAECANAKETVMAVQESFERLHHDLNSDEDYGRNKALLQIQRLLRIYVGAIPRLNLRRRNAPETLRPLFADIVPVIRSIGSSLRKGEGNTVIQLTCNLLSCSTSWAAQQGDEADLNAVKTQCRTILSSTLAELSSSLETDLAQQKFQTCNPRLFRVSGNRGSENNALLQECLDVAISLSYSIDTILQERTTGSLVLLSLFLTRTASPHPPPNSLLAAVFPVLMASLQSNTCIDASLTIVLDILFPSSQVTTRSIDPDFIAPLSTALASIASTSPYPTIRLIAFRALGALVARAPPLERMTLLHDMLTESPFPSLRVAAVGLLKEAILESFTATSSAGRNPFASQDMLRTFGCIVLRTDPPDLFSRPPSHASLQAFLETQEPKRLVECLAFYYVLLMRDERNLTGVRELSQIKSVEKEFLSPLRDTLRAWAGVEDLEAVDGFATMALAALETNLERIDEAYEKLNLEPS